MEKIRYLMDTISLQGDYVSLSDIQSRLSSGDSSYRSRHEARFCSGLCKCSVCCDC